MERWCPIPGYEGYEASDLGRIRSLDRVITRKNGVQQAYRGRVRVLTPSHGRLIVSLTARPGVKGRQTNRFVHQLVLEAFVGPCPPGMECLHANDDATDNRLVNLRWGTHTENVQDCLRNGHNHFANKTHCKRGHPLSGDGADVYIKPNGGGRQCLICVREGPKCTVEGCERHAVTRISESRSAIAPGGLCNVHYMRWRNHGSLERRHRFSSAVE